MHQTEPQVRHKWRSGQGMCTLYASTTERRPYSATCKQSNELDKKRVHSLTCWSDSCDISWSKPGIRCYFVTWQRHKWRLLQLQRKVLIIRDSRQAASILRDGHRCSTFADMVPFFQIRVYASRQRVCYNFTPGPFYFGFLHADNILWKNPG